jgi:hypothetical protein
MSVDITSDPVGRALYIHGPCSASSVAGVLELRGESTVGLPRRLADLHSAGSVSVRSVAMAGQSVDLWYLTGAGIS